MGKQWLVMSDLSLAEVMFFEKQISILCIAIF